MPNLPSSSPDHFGETPGGHSSCVYSRLPFQLMSFRFGRKFAFSIFDKLPFLAFLLLSYSCYSPAVNGSWP
jgi:hypothetical protein